MTKTIEERVQAYRQSLENPRPKVSPDQKLQRLETQLEKASMGLISNDQRRIRLLIRQAGILSQAGNMRELYSVAAELAHMCRIRLIGLAETHPILPSMPPTRMLSSLPPNTLDSEDFPQG